MIKSFWIFAVLVFSPVVFAKPSSVHEHAACRAIAISKAVQHLGNHMGRSTPAERFTIDVRPVATASNQIAVTIQLPGTIAQAMTYTVAFEVNGGCSDAVVVLAQDHS